MATVIVGSRPSAMEIMLDHDPHALVLAHSGSRLESWCSNKGIAHTSLANHQHLLQILSDMIADVQLLMSVGLKWILPVSQLKLPEQRWVNLHPTLLPNFPGSHGVTASLLAQGPFGVTCHTMVDLVDAGDIVHQEEVCVIDPPAEVLYRILFALEPVVVERALEKKMIPQIVQQIERDDWRPFTRPKNGVIIDSSDPPLDLIRLVRSYATPGQYVQVRFGERVRSVSEAREFGVTLPVQLQAPQQYSSGCLLRCGDRFIWLTWAPNEQWQ